MKRKILVMGLPGAGKTTLSKALSPRLNAVHFNADEIRANINRDLGFSEADRIEQARRMGWLCDQVVHVGCYAIADFVCPTLEARDAFLANGDAFLIWVDRIKQGVYEDTNRLFRRPEHCDLHVTAEGSPEFWAEKAVALLRPVFESKKPAALLIGRYQPFHAGHKALIVEAIRRVGQVIIGVRDTHAIDEKNPFSFEQVRARIEHGLREHEGRFMVAPLPNITHVFYGRDVGYVVERIELDAKIEDVSATAVRRKIFNAGG